MYENYYLSLDAQIEHNIYYERNFKYDSRNVNIVCNKFKKIVLDILFKPHLVYLCRITFLCLGISLSNFYLIKITLTYMLTIIYSYINK